MRVQRRLKRVWQWSRFPLNRRSCNTQYTRGKALIDEHRSESWNAYVSELELENGSDWRFVKALQGEKKISGPLKGSWDLVYTAADKAEAFTGCMEDRFTMYEIVTYEDHTDNVEYFL